jgi:hypothetical protein
MTTQAISATGLKGFLQWLQYDQPAIYAATAAKIAKAAPRGFSGFNGSTLASMRLAQGRRSMRLRGYLGGCCAGSCMLAPVPSVSCVTPMPNVCIDVSCAANSGATCASSLTGVANIITAVSGAALNASQAAAYNSMVQSQLARASTGLSPLTLSSVSAGVPIVSASSLGLTASSSSTLLWIGGGALLLWMLLGRK